METKNMRRDAHVALSPIAHNPSHGRWRTEAMRSYSSPRVVMIAKGQGRITVAGRTRGYGPHNLIYIPAKTMWGIEVGPTVFGQMLTIPRAMMPEWPEDLLHLRLRDVIAQKDLIHRFDQIEKELTREAPGHMRAALYHVGLLSVFVERQMAQQTSEERSESAAHRLVAAYADLIERDFRSAKGVADYARTLGVTPTHLTRSCRKTCGKSALQLLNDRIHFEARMLLRETKTQVKDIASTLGFTSPAYFTRSFQAETGQSPSEFRKKGGTA